MKIPIVNEEEKILYFKERDETTRDEIRMITSLFVFSENLDVLIAKRHFSKKLNPNLWGPAVAGTVDEGFDYDSTILKEAEEEIGLLNIKPIFYKKIFYETSNARRFNSIYYVVINKEENKLVIQEDEVSEIKWLSLDELDNRFKEKPEEFIPSFKRDLDYTKDIYEKLSKE